MYREDKNTGLSSTFRIIDGKFELVGGVVKCQDNMRMLLAFANWFRYYYQDFCVNLFFMLQKPTSFISTFKTVTLGHFIDAAKKYAPFINVARANIFYSNQQRKELSLGIEYSYVLDDENNQKQLFVEIINP